MKLERYIKKLCSNIKITQSKQCKNCSYRKIDYCQLWQDRLKINKNVSDSETAYIKLDICYAMVEDYEKIVRLNDYDRLWNKND